jgi:acyl-coenzyme A synthetase/AMP-(fatty) acid ligase
MKPVAIFVLVAAFAVAAVVTSAKNATAPGNTNERRGVAGPKAVAETSQRAAATKGEQPSKSELRKAKVKPKPPLQDPN